MTGDAQLAEDLLQTALEKCWRVWDRIDGDPEPYVRRTLVTTATSWRARKWSGEIPAAAVVDRPGTDDGRFVGELIDLRVALLALPARQRACVVLRYVEDLTEQQTAAGMGITVGAVKSMTHRGLIALRAHPRLRVEGVV